MDVSLNIFLGEESNGPLCETLSTAGSEVPSSSEVRYSTGSIDTLLVNRERNSTMKDEISCGK